MPFNICYNARLRRPQCHDGMPAYFLPFAFPLAFPGVAVVVVVAALPCLTAVAIWFITPGLSLK